MVGAVWDFFVAEIRWWISLVRAVIGSHIIAGPRVE